VEKEVMTEYKKILFCTDFSQHAGHAFEHACAFATMSGGELYVLHVVPSSLDYEKLRSEESAPQQFPEEAKVLELIATSYASACSTPVNPVILHGAGAGRIVEFAKSEGVDLIVMGTRGIGFLEGLLGGGSVADKVVKNASVPVMLVP
jgi:nucleotide-binding universal stress UspA family protein